MFANLKKQITTFIQPNVSFEVQKKQNGIGYYSPVNREATYGLIMIQQAWGLNQSLALLADRFSQKGYQVLVPDLYRGKLSSVDQVKHMYTHLDWPGALADIAGAKRYLQSKNCNRIGIIGFCMGGALTIASVATIQGFVACAPFYGVPDLTKYDVKNIKCKIQCHFAQFDAAKGFSDPQTAQKFFDQLKQHNPTAQLIIWPGVNHAFMNRYGHHFHEATYELALQKVLQLFK